MIRKFGAIIGIIVVIAALYVGSYLPYQQSRRVVSALRQLKSAETVEDIKDALNVAFQYRSPVSHKEAAQKITELLTNSIDASGKESAGIIFEIVNYMEDVNKPLIERAGANVTKQRAFLGDMNRTAWLRAGVPSFAVRAEEHYKRCLENSPRRVECLYGLFEIYRRMNSRETEARAVGEEILKYWPSAEHARNAMEKITE